MGKRCPKKKRVIQVLLQILNQINNFFAVDSESGVYEIKNTELNPVQNNYISDQYIYVSGSILSSNIYRVLKCKNNKITLIALSRNLDHELQTIHDEKFNGTIYSLRIPRDFLYLDRKSVV